MSAIAPAPSRTVPALLLVATCVWAASNLLSLVDQVKVLVRFQYFGLDNYRPYLALWVVAGLIAVLSVIPAIIALTRPRVGYWVAIGAAVSTALDLGTTISSGLQYNGANLGRVIRFTYIDSLKGDYGWKPTNGALSFWLVVPVIIVWLVWVLSRPAARPATLSYSPVGQAPQASHDREAVAASPTIVDAWWVQVSGSSYGPYTWEQLTTYAADGRIDPHAFVRRADGPFVPLSSLIPR